MVNLTLLSQLSRSATAISIGVGVAAMVAYCIYFDHKRRSAPDFRQKLKQKRAAQREVAASKSSNGRSRPMDMSDPQALQAYFLQEVQLGEELLSEGDFEGATEHLATAVMLCGSPVQLLQILQQTLPPQVYQMLVKRLASKRPGAAAGAGDSASIDVSSAVLEETDLE